MGAAGDHASADGSYSSADASFWVPFTPPVTSTFPSGRRTAVWSERASDMLAADDQPPEDGSYIADVSRSLPTTSSPPTTSTLPSASTVAVWLALPPSSPVGIGVGVAVGTLVAVGLGVGAATASTAASDSGGGVGVWRTS